MVKHTAIQSSHGKQCILPMRGHNWLQQTTQYYKQSFTNDGVSSKEERSVADNGAAQCQDHRVEKYSGAESCRAK
jgi:hypothetical protein